ncbi:MAG: ABC transporter substrate-binding protein [Spirochaetia bacterium]|jgi:ribose transport system substrate-binding protein
MAGVIRMGCTLTSCAPLFAAVFLFVSAIDGMPDADAPPGAGKMIRVGFSQTDNLNPWRVAETNSIRKEAEGRGCALLYRDAGASVQRQIEDLAFLISQKVDYIILVPREFDAFGPQLQAARRAGIPVILIDRGAEGTPGLDYVTLIASNFIQEGERAAEWLVQKTAGSATIVELSGTVDSTPVIDRAKGFREVISRYPRMKIVASESGDFLRTQGQKAMEGIILRAGRSMTAVFAHNDEMAIGAIQALKAAGMVPGRDVILVSIDGERDALKAIVAGELGASIECNPRFGPKAFDVIEALRRGEEIPESIVIPDHFFDKQDALEYIDKAF